MLGSPRARRPGGSSALRAGAAAWRAGRLALAALLLLAVPVPLAAQEEDGLDLTALSLEALMNVETEVTTVSKKPQDLRKTPAAVYVLTGEEIRRSGVNSIPEALRLVPGMHVAKAWSHTWDVATRGFNSGFSNKLLVLIDGRSVYTPLFGGVWWDVQDVLLEDIDRIEVIRGTAGAVWGANAVNGVINIITKKAAATQGSLATVEVGTHDRYVVGARHGGTFGETGHWRAYVKGADHDAMDYPDGDGLDDWWQRRAGFRMDWHPRASDTLTFQGDVYDGRNTWLGTRAVIAPEGFVFVDRAERVGGGNLLLRWTRDVTDGNQVQVQTYVDRTERHHQDFGEDRDTFDVEASQHVRLDDVHDLVWGVGYRGSQADYENSFDTTLTPDPRTINIYNVFVQDELTLVPDTLSLTLGNKFEHNSYTGWEIQPTARVAWTPDERQTVWGAVSRAVRMPTSVERDGFFAVVGIPDDGVTGFDQVVAYVPGRDMVSERVYAYEAGWRSQLTDDVHVDVAAYYNDYDDLETEEAKGLQPTADPDLFVLPFVAQNEMQGIGRGVEVGAGWDVREDWELFGAYSHQILDLAIEPNSNDTFTPQIERDVPRNIFHVRSHHALHERWELDALLFYVDSLDNLGVPSYWRGDLRLGWRPTEGAELSFGVRNLFHDEEPESEINDVEAEAYVRGVFRF